MSNIYYWEKPDVLKTFQKRKFLEKEIWRNVLALKSKKVQGILAETFILALLSSAAFLLKTRVSDFFKISFAQEIKGFYQSSLGNDVDFRDIMNVSQNILVKNQNLQKLKHGFVDERVMITTTLISSSSCHCKVLAPFCLQKKRAKNAFLTLTVNYHKVVQKNKLCQPKKQ